jgi:hypothetical protein
MGVLIFRIVVVLISMPVIMVLAHDALRAETR